MRIVKINGKDLPVLARYSAIKMFCEKKGIDFFEFPELLMSYGIDKPDFRPNTKFIDDMALLMFAFLERGAEASGEVLDLKVNDVIDWFLDGNLNVIFELITESQGQSKNVKATKRAKAGVV